MQKRPNIIISVIVEAIGLRGDMPVKNFPMFSGPEIICCQELPRGLYI
jgi:hypothetical protein